MFYRPESYRNPYPEASPSYMAYERAADDMIALLRELGRDTTREATRVGGIFNGDTPVKMIAKGKIVIIPEY